MVSCSGEARHQGSASGFGSSPQSFSTFIKKGEFFSFPFEKRSKLSPRINKTISGVDCVSFTLLNSSAQGSPRPSAPGLCSQLSTLRCNRSYLGGGATFNHLHLTAASVVRLKTFLHQLTNQIGSPETVGGLGSRPPRRRNVLVSTVHAVNFRNKSTGIRRLAAAFLFQDLINTSRLSYGFS